MLLYGGLFYFVIVTRRSLAFYYDFRVSDNDSKVMKHVIFTYFPISFDSAEISVTGKF